MQHFAIGNVVLTIKMHQIKYCKCNCNLHFHLIYHRQIICYIMNQTGIFILCVVNCLEGSYTDVRSCSVHLLMFHQIISHLISSIRGVQVRQRLRSCAGVNSQWPGATARDASQNFASLPNFMTTYLNYCPVINARQIHAEAGMRAAVLACSGPYKRWRNGTGMNSRKAAAAALGPSAYRRWRRGTSATTTIQRRARLWL